MEVVLTPPSLAEPEEPEPDDTPPEQAAPPDPPPSPPTLPPAPAESELTADDPIDAAPTTEPPRRRSNLPVSFDPADVAALDTVDPFEVDISAYGTIFDSSMREALKARLHVKHRMAAVEQNRRERTGHSAALTNSSTSALTRLDDNCYVAPPIPLAFQQDSTLIRGTPVAKVKCPGQLPWWRRDRLDDIAAQRGIP